MPYRTFADEQGRGWEIWDVRPERVERRGVERREGDPNPWTGPERRVADDRGQEREGRIRLNYPSFEGWLVFKSDDEKRRLAPIPPHWETLRGQDLRDLWQEAAIIVERIAERSA